jgi:hypothetical protein
MPILTKSEFRERLKQHMTVDGQTTHFWQEMTTDDFECLYADYYKSGKSFEEWTKEYDR